MEYDFPDIEIIGESIGEYYIVLRTVEGSETYYAWGFGYNTKYSNGSFISSTDAGSFWINNKNLDFCFRT